MAATESITARRVSLSPREGHGQRRFEEPSLEHELRDHTELQIEGFACKWYERHLKPEKWRLFNPKTQDFGFIPAQYSHLKKTDVIKRGEKGMHFAEGWLELFRLVFTYGTLGDKDPETGYYKILDYKGPDLPAENVLIAPSNPRSTTETDVESADPDVEQASPSDRAVASTASSSLRTTQETAQGPEEIKEACTAEKLQVEIRSGGEEMQQEFEARVSTDDWSLGGNGGPPYNHVLNRVLGEEKNHIFVGLFGVEIVGLFAFRFSGREGFDATIKLLWTKGGYRRRGIATELIRRSSGFLVENSLVLSGHNPTKDSKNLYRKLKFEPHDVAYCIEAKKLVKELQRRKIQHRGKEWATDVRLLNKRNGQEIPAYYNLTTEDDDSDQVVNVLFERKDSATSETAVASVPSPSSMPPQVSATRPTMTAYNPSAPGADRNDSGETSTNVRGSTDSSKKRKRLPEYFIYKMMEELEAETGMTIDHSSLSLTRNGGTCELKLSLNVKESSF